MEFRETLLAAQKNQQQKSSGSSYYKARFDPPKKEQKQRDRLSANIQKFLAKKDEEEKEKKLLALKKKEEFIAMRDPKALRKIQKSLKVFKSANKSVLQDAVDHDNTAVTLTGPDQPDQDDYGYESQEAAAIYAKMMQKYSKIPDEPKFPTGKQTVKRDLNGTRERVKNALAHEDDPVIHRRKRKSGVDPVTDRDPSPKPELDKKPDKPKIRKPMPPPMDFNQLLKLAEQKKSEPTEAAARKAAEPEPARPMTKKQRRDHEEEVARRQRRQERLDADKGGPRKAVASQKEVRPVDKERKQDQPATFGRIPKLNDKNADRNNSPRPADRDRDRDRDRNRADKIQKETDLLERAKLEKEKLERERSEMDKLDKLRAERERIERDINRLNRDRERLEKSKAKLDSMEKSSKPDRAAVKPRLTLGDKKSIDLKSQNTYRIDKNSNEKRANLPSRSGEKPETKSAKEPDRDGPKDKAALMRQRAIMEHRNGKARPADTKPKVANFDFDQHVSSLKNGDRRNGSRQFPPGDVKRKPHPDDLRKKKRRALDSESEYDSEMDDFIDDGDEEMDYSRHIKEIFGYDKAKYRHMDDQDDPEMESSFARQQREEYISKKIGIMEDLEDMRLEAMEKKKAKKRRISDD